MSLQVDSLTSLDSLNLAYVSFDRFPSPKGAATHIQAFTCALAEQFGRLDLFTVAPAPDEADWFGAWPSGLRHMPIDARGGHLFERVEHFRVQLWRALQNCCEDRGLYDAIHIRSIFEGYPIAKHKANLCRHLIYEVNGLPSVELKYHYPAVADDRELLRKIREQERYCLEVADLIITVSQVNRRHLISLGVPAAKISVIPNGVDREVFDESGFSEAEKASPACAVREQRPIQLLYCGGLTSWQGVGHALEATALIQRDWPAALTVVGPARPRQIRWLENLAFELGIYDQFRRLRPVGRQELARLHWQSDVVLAPLTANDRNTKQGCCPLKVLEAMASGRPLVASDLEVVRELATNEQEALLVKPGSAKAIKDAVFRYQREPGLAARLAGAARRRVAKEFTWSVAKDRLITGYQGLTLGAFRSEEPSGIPLSSEPVLERKGRA